jgi:hypothetical protein
MDIGMLHVMKYLAPNHPMYGDAWYHAIEAILKKAPKRSDMAETFVQYALQHQRAEQVRELVEAMLARNPHDTCALWYSQAIIKRV